MSCHYEAAPVDIRLAPPGLADGLQPSPGKPSPVPSPGALQYLLRLECLGLLFQPFLDAAAHLPAEGEDRRVGNGIDRGCAAPFASEQAGFREGLQVA